MKCKFINMAINVIYPKMQPWHEKIVLNWNFMKKNMLSNKYN